MADHVMTLMNVTFLCVIVSVLVPGRAISTGLLVRVTHLMTGILMISPLHGVEVHHHLDKFMNVGGPLRESVLSRRSGRERRGLGQLRPGQRGQLHQRPGV